MKVETKGNIITIRDTKSDFDGFLSNITNEYKSFEKTNLIVDLSLYEQLSTKQVNAFGPLAELHKKNKKSFVIVANTAYDKISDKLVVVPTIQEAHDMIEMDEIERDLGF